MSSELSPLPIGIDELLSGAVEGSRLELKATWDARVTVSQVLKVLCAFANDLQNLNGGTIVIGVGESSGTALRPAVGLEPAMLDLAQKSIRGESHRIERAYMPASF